MVKRDDKRSLEVLKWSKVTAKGHLRSNDSYKTLSFAEANFVDCFDSEFEFVSDD